MHCIIKYKSSGVFLQVSPAVIALSTGWLSAPFSLSSTTCRLKQSRFTCICLKSEAPFQLLCGTPVKQFNCALSNQTRRATFILHRRQDLTPRKNHVYVILTFVLTLHNSNSECCRQLGIHPFCRHYLQNITCSWLQTVLGKPGIGKCSICIMI